MPIGIAIIGSGNFAREEHLPRIRASESFKLKAIYSRTVQSAQSLSAGEADIYAEDAGAGKGYSDLLAREDIAAVVIALPIHVQPAFIRQALAAGKHVLSEKPIAKDVATAQELISWSAENTRNGQIWAVAENFRYLGKFAAAAAEVQKLGGIKTFRVVVRSMMGVDSKYYKTEWRAKPEYQGGFVLDGGVHMVAGLRLILEAAGDTLSTLSAISCQQQPHLPPVDTVDAVVKTAGGATGVVSLSWGSAVNDFLFEVVCGDNSVVTLVGDRVTVNGGAYEVPFEGRGVNKELAEFAAAIEAGEGRAPTRLSPKEALADLEVMEGMFWSGEREGERRELACQV